MPTRRTPRTTLEQRIRALPMTLEEFAVHTETYAREHGVDGTLSLRHLQRLVTGDWRSVRPATARLLEAILQEPVDVLLRKPPTDAVTDDRLGRVLAVGYALDDGVVDALRLRLTALRELDRRLGALAVADEVRLAIEQVDDLAHAVALPSRRRALLAVLAELHTLAGWVALDQLDLTNAWRHHNRAHDAAREAESPAHAAHARAQQAVVVAETDTHLSAALALAAAAHAQAADKVSALMSAWLDATKAELSARAGRRDAASRAFDRAAELVCSSPAGGEPYLGLDVSHLDRWRASSLARCPGERTGVSDLRHALDRHDHSFRRAETSLRIDLALALARSDRDAGRQELAAARSLGEPLASPRLRGRFARADAQIESL